ncbi:MAG TPA: hypothetical protein VGB00_00375 [Pyrinomonadaceae bacterium]|jgi:hypothetical protein
MRKFRGAIQINFQYSEYFGPRYEKAGVFLHLTTSDKYEFINAAQWTEQDFGYAVEKGVRDGLIESDYNPDLGISVLLKSVEYDSVDSSEYSFYAAAKSAVIARNILRQQKIHSG